jgi:hypothetical protein
LRRCAASELRSSQRCREYLGTTSEAGIRRVLDAIEADDWFDSEENYIGRDVIGIGIQGRP